MGYCIHVDIDRMVYITSIYQAFALREKHRSTHRFDTCQILSDMTRLIHMLILRAPALTHSCHFMVLSSSPLYLGSGTEGGLTATIWRKSIVIVPPAAVILANLTLSWIIMNNYYWWPFSQIPQLQHIDQTEPAWSKVAQRWVSSSQSNFLWSVCSLRDDPWCLGAGFGNCSLAMSTCGSLAHRFVGGAFLYFF